MMEAWLSTARKAFHQDCLANSISVTGGVPSIADVSSEASRKIAASLISKIGGGKDLAKKPAGQTAGALFEIACQRFISTSFSKLQHMRPGIFTVERGSAIALFEQYSHLEDLRALAESNRELKMALGSDYLIKPDVVVIRAPEFDSTINAHEQLVDDTVAKRTPLRVSNGARSTLHASISCKLTIRSDRVQNTRSEALNLVRNRKGRLPHIMAVTAEPLPSRLAAIALGTGDIDCVYHFALPELIEVLAEQNRETLELVLMMADGRRLRDIADLPLDLAI